MYKQNTVRPSTIRVNNSYIGEPLERKVDRMVNNKEPMKDPGTGLLYTERKEGVRPETDIRTDRFEIAIDATTKLEKKAKAERDERMGKKAKENMAKEQKTESGTQSADTTNN
jgi:hypothetical protein